MDAAVAAGKALGKGLNILDPKFIAVATLAIIAGNALHRWIVYPGLKKAKIL